ncbi:MAG: hypothetical protein B6D39_03965 [Anaerolineae bacterium UTCFX2]|jgi:tetratricopeptide (TPR) repeat protein|nr:tetratricopeptide repeat protein [Anaerolineae bacterium]OQY93051.1 MAG: hypothetical protein B6D39_03965 [Anaerolineae bacterium UTCFX2]
MMKNLRARLAFVLLLASLTISACSGGIGPKPTEKELIIEPPSESITEEAGTPIPTPTLRPPPTQTAEPVGPTEAPTPTNTLDPYNTLLFEGVQLRINEQFDAAIAKFTEAIQMDPTKPDGYIERGITYSNMGKLDEAITDFNFAINYDPQNAQAYNSRGVAWAQKNQFSQAVKDYTQALELDPELNKAHTNRGIAYILQGNVDEGLQDFTLVVERTPDDAEAYFNRGQAYITALNTVQDESFIDLCIVDFTQALTLAPDNPDAYFNRGLCQSFKGNVVRSFEDYSRAIELDATQARFFIYRALLYPEMGTLEQALSDAQKAVELADDPELKNVAEQLLKDLPNKPAPTPGPTPTPLD